MAGYSPLKVTGMATGLVQEREEFILPADAYPVLENAFVWRERIKRKQGYQLLGRLRRDSVTFLQAVTDGTNLYFAADVLSSIRATEPNAQIEPGTVTITIAPAIPAETTIYNDAGGTSAITLVSGMYTISSGSINYTTGALTLNFTVSPPAPRNVVVVLSYFPCLPVMGLRTREINSINNEELIAFDQKYAYHFVTSAWEEFITGTTWTGNDSDFFWSTNYWVDALNSKLFWVTNFSGTTGDPIRYSNGTTWTDFAPTINASADVLAQCLCILPFRSRLVVFNTLEGADLATSTAYRQRIRWSAIGSPIVADAWLDDVRGKGGFIDIPTNEDIVSVGYVRDNLVIYCERSTWQLRYTGRSIAPFQIEKVNTELGAESTFSAVQFDTSLVGVGDKGIVECDSFKSERIDIKIPDLVYQFNNDANGTKRVHGIRDFQQRLSFWTYPYKKTGATFPDRRLVYNYENDSWAIFTDSLTTLGTFQPQSGRRWQDFTDESDIWSSQNTPWIDVPSLFPAIVGGNQQGFVEYLDRQVTNDISLTIHGITGFGITDADAAVRIKSVNHNLQTNQVVQISGIPNGTPFAAELNDNNYGIKRVDSENFDIYIYNPNSGQFDIPQLAPIGTYIGTGEISVRDGFSIKSKKFNFIDEGQNVQIGFIDILMDTTTEGAITLNMYLDYNDSEPTNQISLNVDQDTFFNSIVPTNKSEFSTDDSSKQWHRVFCPIRGNFITIEWTLSNAQLVSTEQESNVRIDAQVIWQRKGGRLGI